MNDKRTLNVGDSSAALKACAVLESGGVVMHPTETCYGFAVDIFNENALDKLFKLKGRDKNKPLSILVDGIKMAQEYGIFSDKALSLAVDFWPGPLSIVVPRGVRLPKWFNIGEDYVSFRSSSFIFCLEMARKFGRPITTTSANPAGEEQLYSPDVSVFGNLSGLIDLVVDGGELPRNKPSTVAKVLGDRVEVLRWGDIEV